MRKYFIRFRIGGRLGTKSAYSLKDIAVSVVDRYSLTDSEFNRIVDLLPGKAMDISGFTIERRKS
jgi:hypothetical protein